MWVFLPDATTYLNVVAGQAHAPMATALPGISCLPQQDNAQRRTAKSAHNKEPKALARPPTCPEYAWEQA